MDVDEAEEAPEENAEETEALVGKLQELTQRNLDLGSRISCFNKNARTQQKCNCLGVLKDNIRYCQAVAEWQLMFHRDNFTESKKVVIEWMRNHPNQGDQKRFRIPFILQPDEDPLFYAVLRKSLVCSNAMMDLLDRSYNWWRSCAHHHRTMTIPGHASVGRVANNKRKFLELYQDDLQAHFQEIKAEAEPIATRTVRDATGTTTVRDADEEVLYLPPYISKRGCYAKFCLEKRGVLITTTNKGAIKKAPQNAADHGDDAALNSVPCWTAYRKFWSDRYPKLKVRKPTEDICSICYKFSNAYKYKTDSSAPGDGDTGEETVFVTEEAEEAQEKEDAEATGGETDDAPTGGGDVEPPVTVDAAVAVTEQAILEAALHVRMASAQRLFANEKIAEARDDRMHKRPHSESVYTFIGDYCQNMNLPHFGKEQPGETYYYNPLNLEGYGFVDVSRGTPVTQGKKEEADHLYFHCYREGEGAKGANCVASMIMKSLRLIGLLQVDGEGKPLAGKELNIIMDNCVGQNKNNVLFHLGSYLVELGYFKTVNLIFLIVGHTKNVCDRRFNNLKKNYNKMNVYVFDEACQILSKSQYVTVWPAENGEDWFNYEDFLLKPYKKLASAKLAILKNHIFTASWDEETKKLRFCARKSSMPEHEAVFGDIVNPNLLGDRAEWLRTHKPSPLIFIGMPNNKRMTLYQKYRPFVPQQHHQDVMYIEPPQQVISSEKEDQKGRKEYKKGRKSQKIIKQEEVTL